MLCLHSTDFGTLDRFGFVNPRRATHAFMIPSECRSERERERKSERVGDRKRSREEEGKEIEYERGAVLKVPDTVDNSILSVQSTFYCCFGWCWRSATCSLVFIQCICLVCIECQCANSAFCIVDARAPPIAYDTVLHLPGNTLGFWRRPSRYHCYFNSMYRHRRCVSVCKEFASLCIRKSSPFLFLFAIKQTNFIIDWKIKCRTTLFLHRFCHSCLRYFGAFLEQTRTGCKKNTRENSSMLQLFLNWIERCCTLCTYHNE